MILAAKDVQFFEKETIEKNSLKFVRISGLVFHSSMAVKSVDLKFKEDTAIIQVEIIPAKHGLSGRFSIDVPLSTGVNKILFGSTLDPIWP